jgi:hypothetical protein
VTASRLRTVVFLAALAAAGVPAGAQPLPQGPVRAFDGRLVVGGEVSVTFGDEDDIAFFNFTDYEHNALRMVRLALSGLWRPVDWVEFVAEARSEDLDHPEPQAAYVRIRPWRDRKLDIQVGRIPPSFGAYARRTYSNDNPVIGYPLAYQYLTSLRTDAVPGTAEDLLRMRGRGWKSSFPIGSPTEAPGVPLVSAFRWDTGVQVQWIQGPVSATGSVTVGTLCHALFTDDNGGKTISGRVAVKPRAGLVLGASGATGAWLSDAIPGLDGRRPRQNALGADAEYSRDHWMVRTELVWSSWGLAFLLPPSTDSTLSAVAISTEGRYRITPRFFAGARVDHLRFSDIVNPLTSTPISWDGKVDRLETGLGWYLQRNLVGRVIVQPNWRDAGRVHQRTYLSAQINYWF